MKSDPSHPAQAAPVDARTQGAARPPVRLAYLVSHPIQYQTPFLRRIAQDPTIDLTVFFGSDFSVSGYRDEGFGVDIKWDVPLLEGYKYEILPKLRDAGREYFLSPISYGILSHLGGRHGEPPFDVLWVHGYTSVNQLHGILAAKALGIPVLIRSDSSLENQQRSAWKRAAKRIFFAALRSVVDGVLIVGSLSREYWQHYLGPDFPLFLMPYAVDNAWFQQQCRLARETRAQLQQELDLDPSRPVILFASKLRIHKHCDHLIEAYARLCPAVGQEPDPYLLIVGDGEDRPALEQQAAATGLSSIRFCGFRNQSELPRFFDLCTVFAFPARLEAWGLIVNEVMNAARPVILTPEVGCQRDLITDGVEGCVFQSFDLDGLEDALRRTLAPGAAERMGQRALHRINTWSFEEDLAGLHQAIAHVTGQRARAQLPTSDTSAA